MYRCRMGRSSVDGTIKELLPCSGSQIKIIPEIGCLADFQFSQMLVSRDKKRFLFSEYNYGYGYPCLLHIGTG